ncbi:hypothetical protein Q7P37_000927 [Cladosporium fusiforme]
MDLPTARPKQSHHRHLHLQERAWPFNPTKFTGHIPSIDGQRKQLVTIIDEHGFNWRVWAVAATGFFTDSYNLFASNIILPCLAFVYWGSEHEANLEITINALTLAGSTVGMVIFGFLADKYGRQRLYGIELMIVIFSTIGLAQSSVGWMNHSQDRFSMRADSWIMAWRFIMGIGIGAEYPLSACITAEWAATRSRGRMMAAVFIMQPVGQLLAWAVAMAAITGISRDYNLDVGQLTTDPDEIDSAKIGIDILWRIVVGVGAVPAAIAILFRWTIPESGRFTYDVKQDTRTAFKDTRKVYEQQQAMQSENTETTDATQGTELTEIGLESGQNDARRHQNGQDLMPQLTGRTSVTDASFDGFPRSSFGSNDNDMWEVPDPEDDEEYSQFTYAEMHSYFIKEGNWRYLVGTSLAWLLLDFAFYGLGFNNPGTMAKLWTAKRQPNRPSTPSWLLNSSYGDDGTIRQVLLANAKNTTLTTSIASILGALAVIALINRFDRRKAMIWAFALLALALLVLAILFNYLFHTIYHWVLVIFYALVQFAFAFGPNTLTFILPAEIFPTRYRCSAYGIAAASGKLGSVFVQLAFLFFDAGGIKDPNSMALGKIIYLFAAFMALGAVVTWAWIPSVQARDAENPRRLRTRTLEELGGGLASVGEEEKIGARLQARRYREWIRRRRPREGE